MATNLGPIADKVDRGERLTREDGLALFASADLLAIGRLADAANRRRNGDRVYFAANQHINPTNVCILRNTCVFCSFARMPKEDGAYTRSLDEVFVEADAARENPTREFHIVGGLHPKLRLAYYLDMFRGLKARHPTVMIKALSAIALAAQAAEYRRALDHRAQHPRAGGTRAGAQPQRRQSAEGAVGEMAGDGQPRADSR